jgi:hypothetical protein
MASTPLDETSIIYELVRRHVWGMMYHERELRLKHRKLSVLKAMLQSCFPEIEYNKIAPAPEDEDDRDDADNPINFMRNAIAQTLASISWHEREMREAHGCLALAKAVVVRGNYEIDIAAITAEQARQLED